MIINKNILLSDSYGNKLKTLLYMYDQNKAINLIKSG